MTTCQRSIIAVPIQLLVINIYYGSFTQQNCIAESGEKTKLLMLLLFSGLMIKHSFLLQIPFNFKRPSQHCQQHQINRPLIFFGSLFLDTCGYLSKLFFLFYFTVKTSSLTNLTFVFQIKL